MIKKLIIFIFLILLFVASVVLSRAFFHKSDPEVINAINQIILNETQAIKNLSQSIKFKTVSHPDYEKFNYLEFQSFLDWLEREYTNIFEELDDYLVKEKGIRYVTAFRDNTNYISSARKGIGIFEMGESMTAQDREEWKPLLSWLKPKKK